MRVLIATGGTGGHIYPAISIAQELKERDDKNEVLFVGATKEAVSSIIKEAGFKIYPIEVKSWQRRISRKSFSFFYSLLKGLFQSAKCILYFRPDVVLGMGGYASGPPLAFSFLLGYKTMIHEQNSIPGLTNRILGRWANRIALSFRDDEGFFPGHKVVITGNPTRREIGKIPKREALNHFGFGEDRLTILVFGGSRGAHSINLAVIESLSKLNRIKDEIQMVHISGREDYPWMRERIKKAEFPIYLVDFLFEMPLALAAADLVVGRAGAGSIAEITKCGLPSILIPYPYATNNHQYKNALVLKEAGASIIILDKELNGEILAERIIEFSRDRERLKDMGMRARMLGHPEAASKIVDLIYELGKSK